MAEPTPAGRPRGSFARDAGSLTVGKTVGDLLTFFFFVVLSRSFGQEGLGQYSFAMALTGFLLVSSNFGLYYLTIKEISRLEGSVPEYFGGILTLRSILVAVSLTVLALMVTLLPLPRETRLVVLMIGLYQIGYTVLNGSQALFVARNQMHVAASLEIALRALTTLVGVSVALGGGGLVRTIAAMPASAAVMVVVSLVLAARCHGRPRLSRDRAFLRRTLREARPFAVSQLLFILSSRVDVLFVGAMLGAAAAGIYNAAYRVVFLLMFLAHLISVAVLPRASRLFVENRRELEGLYHLSLNLGVLVFLPASAGVYLIAPEIVPLIYGDGFDESIGILRLLAWLFVLAGTKSLLEVFMMAVDRQRERTRVQWYAAGLNVSGNLVLILVVGLPGAAIATLVSEGVLVALMTVKLRREFGWPRIGSRLLLSGMASAAFLVPLTAFGRVPMLLAVPAAVAIYVSLLAAFRSIREHEGRMVLGLARGLDDETRS